jgi:hypothetical protein
MQLTSLWTAKMSDEHEMFTKDQVNSMLKTQAVNLRLDSIAAAISMLSKDMLDHTNNEGHEMRAIVKAIEEGANERRRAEVELKKVIDSIDKDHYEKFVKKTDLKLYAILVVTVVTLTTGVIAWVGTATTSQNQSESVKTMLNKVETLLNRRLGNDN